jgi:PTH1 family peptidyl-tRNA hydrolase
MQRLLVIGLGNADPALGATRHNAGRRLTGALSALLRPTRLADTAGCALFRATRNGREWLIAEPLGAMNDSGRFVGPLITALGIRQGELLIALDDVNLPVGAARLRADGSDGGHRGLRSVLATLGTHAVPRLRIGVGRPPRHVEMGDWVLSTPRPADNAAIDLVVAQAAEKLIAG